MAAIIIPSNIPATIVALSQEAIDRIETACENASAVAAHPITTLDDFAAADKLHGSLNAMEKELEKQRKALKEPVLALGRQIDEAAKDFIANLADAKRLLARPIDAYREAENRRREEERRKAEAAARAEENRRIAEQEAQRQADAAAAAWDTPPGEEPPKPAPFDGQIVRPVIPAPTPPPLKSSVTKRVDKKLRINDASKIPRDINGIPLLLPDEAAIRRILLAGIAVAGCELIEVEVLGSVGRRAEA